MIEKELDDFMWSEYIKFMRRLNCQPQDVNLTIHNMVEVATKNDTRSWKNVQDPLDFVTAKRKALKSKQFQMLRMDD